MCSPDYLARHPELIVGGMAAVEGSDLLTTSWGPSFGSNPSWPTWFHRAGLEMPELSGFQVGRSSLALDLARAGVGVALAQRMLGAADLADGRLTALSPTTMDLGHPYCLVHPHGKARKRSLLALLDWLVRSAKPLGFGSG
jgi:LysR family glycine cleavage system transcriptional activator